MTLSGARPVRAVLASYLLTVVSRAADIVFFLVAFGSLPLDEVAEFSLAAAVAAFFAVAIDFGINTIVLREFSTGGLSLRRGAAIGASMRAVTVPSAILLVALWMHLDSSSSTSFSAVQLACVVQILVLVEVHCYQWLRSRDSQVLANTLAAADCVLKAGSVLLLAVFHQLSSAERVFGVQIGYHVVLVAVCVLIVVRLRGQEREASERQSATSVRDLLRGAMPLAAVALITALQNRFDWIMVARFLDETALASYSVANRAYEIVLLMAGTAAVTTYPYLCRDVANGTTSPMTSLLRVITLSCGVLGAGTAAILLPAVFETLWPGKYTEARAPLQYLMAIACMSCVVMTVYYEAAARRAEGEILKISIGATIVQLMSNAVLIPSLGVSGAVIGMAGLILTSAVAYALLSRSRWPSAVPVRALLTYGMGGAISCIVITSVPLPVPVGLAALIVLWATGTWFGLLQVSDRALIRATIVARLPQLTDKLGMRSS